MIRSLSNLNRRPASVADQPTADWVIVPNVRRVHLLFPLRQGVYAEQFSHYLSAFGKHLEFLIDQHRPSSLQVYVAPNAKQQIVNDLLSELTALASDYDISLSSHILLRGTADECVHLLSQDVGVTQ